MGAEKACKLRQNGREFTGTALLEGDFLAFRGDAKRTFRFSELQGVEAKDGVLVLRLAKETAELELGPIAAKWADKIAKPKGILEKLGVTPASNVGVVGDFDEAFVSELEALGAKVSRGAKGKGLDHVLFATANPSELAKVSSLAARLTPAGGVWIVYPKGRKDIREADVLAAGRAAGLKDVKVARFSETHTALRFVVPVEKRKS